jgi:hypothetical protein
MNLRREAEGKMCQVRYEGVCNFDPTTTVLAHVRVIGVSGLGIKSPDLLGVWACSACHAYADTHHDAETERDFLRGFVRTLAELLRRGKVKA